MNGQLSEHPLAELISEISAKNLSGALRLARELVKAVLYFETGELIYATSNLRGYRLAQYLQKHNLASAREIAATKQSRSDFALAAALLSSGVLTRNALVETLEEQVADVLRMLLLWREGEWDFDNRARLGNSTRVRLQTRQLLIESARRMELRFASSRFQNPREMLSRARITPDGLSLLSTEGFLLSRVEDSVELGELTAISGLREPEALQTIYGLVLAGFLQRESWPDAFREAVKGAARPETVASSSAPNEAPAETTAPERDAKEELNEFLERLSQANNHYEVLNISASAGVGEIRHAYHALARRFHPDRFHELAGTLLHRRLESAFARITQANETLANPNLRATYEAKLAALKRVRNSAHSAMPGSAQESQTSREDPTQEAFHGGEAQQAEKSFQEGLAALKLGQINVAVSSFSAAARVAPNQPKYRAYYGRALASNQKTRRLAEAELQAAVRLDAANSSYRVMLAALYRDLGFYRRALAEVDRVLSLDSKNAEAHALLRTLELNRT